MRLDYQNLDDGEIRRFWSHGRAWLRRSGDWYLRRFGSLCVEWSVPSGPCGWGITIGGGDSGTSFGITLAIPFLVTIYLTLERAFKTAPFTWDVDRGQDRQISCYFHDWGFWYSLGVGSMASWSRRYPWCRWYRQGHIDFRNLFGKQQYTCMTVKEGMPVLIPMPEGVYHGTAKIQRQTWKRPLWFGHSRVSTWIDVPKGVPFAGKGENSWDCGDDGLFGCGVEGLSLEKAIGHYVESVLESRRRYGMPSQQAIQEALS